MILADKINEHIANNELDLANKLIEQTLTDLPVLHPTRHPYGFDRHIELDQSTKVDFLKFKTKTFGFWYEKHPKHGWWVVDVQDKYEPIDHAMMFVPVITRRLRQEV